MRKLRILINTNAPWSISGYGQQIAEIIPQIVKNYYGSDLTDNPFAVSCFYGLEGGILEKDGVRYYPKIDHAYGSDSLLLHSRDHRADVVFSYQDIWVLDPNHLKQIPRWIPITFVDHEPVPPPTTDKLRMAYRIVTVSKFGTKEVKNSGLHSTYIPLSVDTEVMKPLDKNKCRDIMNFPHDAFIFGMVAANKDNPPRKSFQEVLEAFAAFSKNNPKAILLIHTNPDMNGGFPLRQFSRALGIADKVFFPDPYKMIFKTGKSHMAEIYSSLDCLLAPSANEGFGVPIIEAQACGVPVITNNFTSMPELIKPGKTGFLTDIAHKRLTGLLSYNAVPKVQSILNAMISIKKADRVKMGEVARQWIVEEYDTKVVYERYWKPFLATLEREIIVQ